MAIPPRELWSGKREDAALKIARFLAHAKRAGEITGSGAARRWALRAVEELLAARRFDEARKTAGEYGLDRDGAVDEAISRAGRRVKTMAARRPDGSPVLNMSAVFRAVNEPIRFMMDAQKAVYGYSRIEEESLRHMEEVDERLADERRGPPEPGGWTPRSARAGREL